MDLSKDTFHHPAVRAPWCELTPPLTGRGSFDLLRVGVAGSGGSLRTPGGTGAYERVPDEGGKGGPPGGDATAIQIGTGRK